MHSAAVPLGFEPHQSARGVADEVSITSEARTNPLKEVLHRKEQECLKLE